MKSRIESTNLASRVFLRLRVRQTVTHVNVSSVEDRFDMYCKSGSWENAGAGCSRNQCVYAFVYVGESAHFPYFIDYFNVLQVGERMLSEYDRGCLDSLDSACNEPTVGEANELIPTILKCLL